MTAEVSLDKVYEEVKRVRLELKSIEKALDTLVGSLIPAEKIRAPKKKKSFGK